jgi:hypothetical protein
MNVRVSLTAARPFGSMVNESRSPVVGFGEYAIVRVVVVVDGVTLEFCV